MRKSNMGFMKKMDILDFIIETLKEQEKTFDELTYKLEVCLKDSQVAQSDTRHTIDAGTTFDDWH